MLAALLQAAQKQSGDQQKHEGHRNLRHHEDVAQTESPSRARECIFALKRIGKNRPRRSPCGSKPQQNATAEADDKGIEQRAPIDGDMNIKRYRGRKVNGGERLRGGEREEHAKESAGKTEQRAFNQQLPPQSRACCTQRDTHSHLTLAGSGLREEQVRNVCARNRKQKKNDDRERCKERESRGSFTRRQ